ncbi:hypothetical protein [Solirhodobacter olei]|uniref:hypothetical protein n=1 Tax=Solirhodobacter olei TaxID=2493082 RepID=UPI000FDA0546|nr:hypothetical protein [Solirhodobacter olei]
MKKTYWARSGTYQITFGKFWSLIPTYGAVAEKGKRLEKFRQATQVYRDLYNNGFCNRFAEVQTVLGITPKHFGVHYRDQSGGLHVPAFLAVVERSMDQFLRDAAEEQGIDIVELSEHQRIERIER